MMGQKEGRRLVERAGKMVARGKEGNDKRESLNWLALLYFQGAIVSRTASYKAKVSLFQPTFCILSPSKIMPQPSRLMDALFALTHIFSARSPKELKFGGQVPAPSLIIGANRRLCGNS